MGRTVRPACVTTTRLTAASAAEQAALKYAAEWHGDQKYGSEPYTTHLVAVHKAAVEFKLSSEIRVASYLHDILEDTEASYVELERRFGSRVAKLVEAVTGRGETRKERIVDSYKKIVEAGPEAVLLKLCDRLANVRASRRSAYGHPRDSKMWSMYVREWGPFRTMVDNAMEKYEDKTWCLMMAELAGLLS